MKTSPIRGKGWASALIAFITFQVCVDYGLMREQIESIDRANRRIERLERRFFELTSGTDAKKK